MKFRAIMPKLNATIIFTFENLLEDKYSNRYILIPWLKAGNQPDRFVCRINEGDLFENDIIAFHGNYTSREKCGEKIGILKWSDEKMKFIIKVYGLDDYDISDETDEFTYHTYLKGNAHEDKELLKILK